MAKDFCAERFMLTSGMCNSDDLLCGLKQADYIECLMAEDFCLKFATCNM